MTIVLEDLEFMLRILLNQQLITPISRKHFVGKNLPCLFTSHDRHK